MTVMVVDHDRNRLKRSADALTNRQAMITVVLFGSSRAATEFAMCHAVDVVFVQSTLPDISGQQLLKELKRYQPVIEGYLLHGDEVPSVGVAM